MREVDVLRGHHVDDGVACECVDDIRVAESIVSICDIGDDLVGMCDVEACNR